mgnify:FL=1
MNLQKNGMNGQERKEWEALCRQYNVDSLYEAIQGCREELEFLIHCAERLEPRTEQDEDSKKRRLTHTDHSVSPYQKTPFNRWRKRRFSPHDSEKRLFFNRV